MTHLTITIILSVVFCTQTINGQCPNGKPSTKACDITERCSANEHCYRRNSDQLFCCGELDKFCPTKMHAVNMKDSNNAYLFEPSEGTNKEEWYNVKLGDDTIACPIPFSYTYRRYKEATMLPVDFDSGKRETSAPKACKTNAECKAENDEFCGEVTHPTFSEELDRSGVNKASLNFCYKFQNFGSTKIHPFIKPDAKGLIGCNSDSECFTSHGSDTVCFIKKGVAVNIVNNAGENKPTKGVCAKVNACDASKHGSLSASLSKDNTFCKVNEDCQGAGISKGQPGMEPECVDAVGLLTTVEAPKLCCFQHDKRCEVGIIQTPSKTCANFKDCNSDATAPFKNMWCDEAGKYCCRDLHNKLWQCPDGATPLFNEPKCNGYSAADVTSGTCPDNTGICKYGHCCPPLKVDNANKTTLGQKPYTTNVDCEPGVAVPNQFSYAFCDPVSKKIVILGEKHVTGEPIAKDDKKCSLNKDCSDVQVCVTLVPGERNCFHNPLKPLKANASKIWLYALIASGSATVVFLCFSILCFWCYRSKSIIDKYKKDNKKNKKTKKGSNSSEMTSEDVKSKKWQLTIKETKRGQSAEPTDNLPSLLKPPPPYKPPF